MERKRSDQTTFLSGEDTSHPADQGRSQACAYVHVSDNPYVLMKEAYGASRVHLNTFRLLEGKSVQ
ncbi:Stachyose synthase [Nymphaea thermarum]|nr:Stachyose synthase [Nymphaea thermarum]